MKRLIVNADDLGLSPSVNEGIQRAVTSGPVRSATALPGAPFFRQGIEALLGLEGVGIGIHLNLTGAWDRPGGRTAPGFFRDRPGPLLCAALAGRLDLGFAEGSLRRQIEAFLDTGRRPTHLDGHHHVHVFPRIARLVAALASEYGIQKIRMPRERFAACRACGGDFGKRLLLHGLSSRAARLYRARSIRFPNRFLGFGLMGRKDFHSRFLRLLEGVTPGVTEIMVHPGTGEADGAADAYVRGRAVEAAALTAEETGARLRDQAIRPISFADF